MNHGRRERGETEGRSDFAAGLIRLSLGLHLTLIQELSKHRQVRYVQVQRGSDCLLVQNQAG